MIFWFVLGESGGFGCIECCTEQPGFYGCSWELEESGAGDCRDAKGGCSGVELHALRIQVVPDGEHSRFCMLVGDGVDLVHPVAIRSAEFCTLWSASTCVFTKSGLQAMLA